MNYNQTADDLWVNGSQKLEPNQTAFFIFLFIQFLFLTSLLSVNPAYSQGLNRCYTEVYNQALLTIDNFPGQSTFEGWLAKLSNTQAHLRKRTEIYRIPVVIHIIHFGKPIGEGYNFTESHIKQQIEVLNDDFRRRNADTIHTPEIFKNVAVDTHIEFELAKIDPDGAPTTGIVRKDGSSLMHLDSMKTLSYWPAEAYINVWVIDYGPRSQGLSGFAQFPVSTLPGLETMERNRLTDGIVINAMYFGVNEKTKSLGRTLVHEIGHFLGLIHLWGTPPPSHDGCAYDDYCTDTPNTAGPNFDCSTLISTCSSKERQMPENFMDYSLDACMNLFTADQRTRMRTVLENSPRRASLLSSLGLKPVVTDLKEKVSVYPNPSRGEFTLTIKSDSKLPVEVKIINLLGEVILTEQTEVEPRVEYKTKLSQVPPGVYLLKVQGAGISSVKPVIILREN